MKEQIFFRGGQNNKAIPINRAGVDRVVLIHVNLKKIYWDVFEEALSTSRDIVFDDYQSWNRTCYCTEEGDKFHYLNISDSKIGRMSFGANPQRFGTWEFSPKNSELRTNIVNFSGDDFIAYLEKTRDLVLKKYGLEVTFTACRLKEIELNTTFALEYSFSDYYRALNVLFSRMPYLRKKYEYSGAEKKEKKLQSISEFNNQISVTAYNKGLEMEINFKTDEKKMIMTQKGENIKSDLMRVEFKLKTAEICSKWFKDLNVMGDFKCKMIDEAFSFLLNYYFFEPLKKWETDNRRYLKRLVRNYLNNAKKGFQWKTKLLTELRNDELKTREVKLLDIEDLNIVIASYSDKRGHKERLLLKDGFSGFATNDVFLSGTRQKLMEIVESLKASIKDSVE